VLFSPLTVSVVFSLLAMPSSILGNEAAMRFGRYRALTILMLASALVAIGIAFSVTAPPFVLLALLLLYAVTVPADSGALTSGMTMSAAPSHKGATMALHTTVGFGLSAAGAWGAGFVLDLAGGPGTSAGWSALFALLAASILLGPLALRWSQRERNEQV
jgi:hypothetical protein